MKETVTKESDRVLTLLTDNGIVHALAKAAKNIKSKKFTATSQFCYSEFILYEGGELYIVNDASEFEVFYNLRNDIVSLSLAQYFSELIIAVTPEMTDTEEILRLVLNSLNFICNGNDILKIKSVFELRLMAIIGFMPNLVSCKECGKFEDDYMYFNPLDASITCKNCFAEDISSAFKLNNAEISVMRHIIYSDFNKIFSFTASEDVLKRVSAISEKYVETMVDRRFATLNYFNSVRI